MTPKEPSKLQKEEVQGKNKFRVCLNLAKFSSFNSRLYSILDGLRGQSFASLAFNISISSRAGLGLLNHQI